NITTENVEQRNAIDAGYFPPGSYRICIYGIDPVTQDVISTPVAGNSCAEFSVEYLQPPVITGEEGGQGMWYDINTLSTTVQWYHRDPRVPPHTITVQVRSVTFEEAAAFSEMGRPQDQFDAYPATFPDVTLVNFELSHLIENLPLDIETYRTTHEGVFLVRVVMHPDGGYISNQGRSNIVILLPGLPNGSNLCDNPNIVTHPNFPMPGDTIPYLSPFITLKFEPLCESIIAFRADMQIMGMGSGSSNSSVYHFENNWPNGPLAYLRNWLRVNTPNTPDVINSYIPDNEVAQYLTLYQRPSDPQYFYERGRSYRHALETEFRKQTRTGFTLNQYNQSFELLVPITAGMPKPILISPTRYQEVNPSMIELNFKPGIAPSKLLPDYSTLILDGNRLVGVPWYSVMEKCVIQVSRVANDFSNPNLVFCQVGTIQANANDVTDLHDFTDPTFHTFANTSNPSRTFSVGPFSDQIYGDRSVLMPSIPLTPENDTLYWRVVWLKNPDAINVSNPCTAGISITDDMIYHSSEVVPFILSNSVAATAPSTSSEPGSTAASSDCERVCTYPEIPTAEKVNSSGIVVGDIIHVGAFQFTISEISSRSPTSYTGTGVLNISDNIKLRVDFRNAGINTAKKMFSGNVEAMSEVYSNRPRSNVLEAAIVVDAISEIARFSQAMSGAPTMLPLGLDLNANNDLKLVGCLDKATFTPTSARAEYLFGLKLPEEMGGVPIILAATNVCLNPSGSAPAGRYMVAETIDAALDNGWRIGINGGTNPATSTYIEFDCTGFVSFAFRGKVTFPRSMLVPENATTGEISATEQVSTIFGTVISRGDEFIINLTFDKPFQFTDMPGFGFTVNSAVLDFSEAANHPSMNFPTLYSLERLRSSMTGEGVADMSEGRLREAWTGFFLRDLSLRLPKDLASARPGIGINNVLIDPSGFTIEAGVYNIWSTPQDSEHGYALSLDTLAVGVIQSTVGYLRMAGGIKLPIFKETQTLHYGAALAFGGTPPAGSSPGAQNVNLIFTIHPGSTGLDIPMWDIAKIVLEPSTRVNLSIGSNFEFSFAITGSVSFASSNNPERESRSTTINMPSIRLENLRFTTRESGFKGAISLNLDGTNRTLWSQASPQKDVSGFPINLDGINIALTENFTKKYDIRFMLAINLGGQIGAKGDLAFRFKLGEETSSGFDQFSFVEFLPPSSIKIEVADMGGVSLKGEISYCPDGLNERFIGGLSVGIPCLGQINLYADFGTKRDNLEAAFNSDQYFSFFAIEGSVILSTGVVMFPGIALYGLGGGVYHHMRRTGSYPTLNMARVSETSGARIASADRGSMPPATPIGCASAPFEPHFGTFMGFGFKAYLGDVGGGSAYNFDVAIEAVIRGNPDGSVEGLQSLTFNGNIYVQSDIGKGNSNAPLRGNVNVAYTRGLDGDGTYEGVHGTIAIYLNVYNVVTGSGADNKMVDAVFHVDNRDMWYFYLGAPSGIQSQNFPSPGANGGYSPYPSPAGIKALGGTQLDAYFMIGKGIPDLPPINPKIEAIIARANGDQSRVEESLATVSELPRTPNPSEMNVGDGFAHGLNFETPNTFNFLLFYASLDVVLGYNINVRQYPGASCLTVDASSGASTTRPLGINGWYAKGNAYAGLEGELGIGVDFDFFKANIPIIEMGCAVSMEARFPSPEYFKGRASMYYSILSGAVEGKCNFVFELGEKCYDPNYNPLDGLTFIGDVIPEGEDVSTMTQFNASFILPMKKELALEDEEYSGPEENKPFMRYFIPEFIGFEITKVDSVGNIPTKDMSLIDNGNAANVSLVKELQSFTKYRVKAIVNVKERIGSRLVWVHKSNGELWSNTVTKEFTTGEMKTMIIPENIVSTYPIQKQRNFMKGEVGEPQSPSRLGWIEISTGQNVLEEALTTNIPSSNGIPNLATRTVSYEVLFDPATNNISAALLIIPANYISNRKLTFEIPNSLSNDQIYRLRIRKKIIISENNFNINNNFEMPNNVRQRVSYDTRQYRSGDVTSTAIIRNRQLELSSVPIDDPNDNIMFEYFFRTSKYNTLAAKLSAMSFRSTSSWGTLNTITLNGDEPFDRFDKWGYTSPATNTTTIHALVLLNEPYSDLTFNPIKDRIYKRAYDIARTTWRHNFNCTSMPDINNSMYNYFQNNLMVTQGDNFWLLGNNTLDLKYKTPDNNVFQGYLPQKIQIGSIVPTLEGIELDYRRDNSAQLAMNSINTNSNLPSNFQPSNLGGLSNSVIGATGGGSATSTSEPITITNMNELSWYSDQALLKNKALEIVSRLEQTAAQVRLNERGLHCNWSDVCTVRSGATYLRWGDVYSSSLGGGVYLRYGSGRTYPIQVKYHRPGQPFVVSGVINWTND
ncbi:MAG: hypothetical protein KA010_02625, partial [Saprospiraceae bacterium]|nr:hypothetical protein [Saprospiraceae bacterium]